VDELNLQFLCCYVRDFGIEVLFTSYRNQSVWVYSKSRYLEPLS